MGVSVLSLVLTLSHSSFVDLRAIKDHLVVRLDRRTLLEHPAWRGKEAHLVELFGLQLERIERILVVLEIGGFGVIVGHCKIVRRKRMKQYVCLPLELVEISLCTGESLVVWFGQGPRSESRGRCEGEGDLQVASCRPVSHAQSC